MGYIFFGLKMSFSGHNNNKIWSVSCPESLTQFVGGMTQSQSTERLVEQVPMHPSAYHQSATATECYCEQVQLRQSAIGKDFSYL